MTAGVNPDGRCAMLRQTGSPHDLRPAARFLHADWLPQSGGQPWDVPPVARRVPFFYDMPEDEAVTDLCLPRR